MSENIEKNIEVEDVETEEKNKVFTMDDMMKMAKEGEEHGFIVGYLCSAIGTKWPYMNDELGDYIKSVYHEAVAKRKEYNSDLINKMLGLMITFKIEFESLKGIINKEENKEEKES